MHYRAGSASIFRIADGKLRAMPYQTRFTTLDELRTIAFDAGCSPTTFNNALRHVGTIPEAVASFLQRSYLSWQTCLTESQRLPS
jgi:hypothetical protein